MAYVPLSNDDLFALWNTAQLNATFVGGVLGGQLFLCTQSGFRSCEVLDTKRWSLFPENDAFCQTAKGGGIRQIEMIEFLQPFKYWFLNNGDTDPLSCYSRLLTEGQRIWGMHQFRVEDKSEILHIGRHASIKYLYSVGASLDFIQGVYQFANQATILEYLTSSITIKI